MAQAATQASGSIVPAVLVLNPVAKSTTVILSVITGTSNYTVQVDASLDDPSILGGPTTQWALLSSAATMLSSITGSLIYTVLSPIAQVRISSTQNSSLGTATIRALQSITN